MEEQEDKTLTLKALEKATNARFKELQKAIDKLEKEIEVVVKAMQSRR